MLEQQSIRLARILNISENQVINTINLIDEGATIPFIARYRKEVTGGLDDIILRRFETELTYIRELDLRREAILKSISEQGKLTDELEIKILSTQNKTELEDLYLPYKPKRKTKASIAKEAGLEPFAMEILNNQNLDLEIQANNYLNPEKAINSTKDVLEGVKYILIEYFAENAELLNLIRTKLSTEASIQSNVIADMETLGEKFKDYFAFDELITKIPSHRILAIFRGFNEKVLQMKIIYPEIESSRQEVSSYEKLIHNTFNININSNCGIFLQESARLAFKTKIFLSLETEILNNLKERADEEAIKVFANNLHNLLLQAPAGAKTTIGLDPGIRTGVKVAVVSNIGTVLDSGVIYPFTDETRAMNSLYQLALKYKVELISIGNGTASRETEKFVNTLIKKHSELNLQKVVVSEAGASVYSASEYASLEFPNLDVSIRGAISIAKRLQDPLAELVKIDPKSIGVGQYQHDVNQNKLNQTLGNVVEDCVNLVGVELNTASVPLLTKVAGLNQTIANNIVEYRNINGEFTSRTQLKKVARLGEKAFEQCAGFLRIAKAKNPLDNSAVHPESYPLVDKICRTLSLDVKDLIRNTLALKQIKPKDLIDDKYGLPTVMDVLSELEKPGRDPRGEFHTVTFDDDIQNIEDLKIGFELEGVITNVTNFGAFVDIGVHQDGLVHISELSDTFVSDPNEVVKTGQIVKVRVIELDIARKRIALSMKKPGSVIHKNTASHNIKKPNNNSNNQNAMANAFASLKLK